MELEIPSSPLPEDYSFFQDSLPLTFSNPNKRPKIDNNNFFDFEHDSSVLELLNQLSDNPSSSIKHNKNNQQMSCTEHHFINSYPHSGNSSNTKRARDELDDISTPHRRLWVKTRSKAWWDQINSPDCPDDEFKKAFRMSKATFTMICQELEPVITKKDTMLRLAIPVRQRVAVCIWRLATGEALREVSKRFGLGISTCHKLILEVCTAIKTMLMPKFLNWPNEDRMKETKIEFESTYGVPNVCGSMYTTHIPIVAPKANVSAYFNKRLTERNQKSSYSITVQGVFDCNGVFTDICIGWPGSMTNERVLEKSALFQRGSNGGLSDVCVAGNSSFPLMDWLMVPYSDRNLTWAKHGFNEKMEGVEGVGKGAFGRLKGRWKCLLKRNEMKLGDLPVVIGACCVLHNICEMRNEGSSDEVEPEEMSFEVFDDEVVVENGVRSVDALSVRDEIAHKLLHHVGRNFL